MQANARRAAVQCAALAVSRRQPSSAWARLAAGVTQRRHFAAGGFPFGGGFPGAPPAGDTEKLYRLLDISKGASESDIKGAYKKKAMKHHPDRGGDEATFKEISRAYEVLSNPEKRQIYDTYGEQGLEGMDQGGGAPSGGPDPFDLFSQVFGFNPGGRPRHQGKPRTQDSAYELQLSLEELYVGTRRSIVFTRDAICSGCGGQGGADRKQCSSCNGKGVQVQLQQMGLFVSHVQTPCKPCGGKGYIIPKASICKVCHGKCTTKEKTNFAIDVEPGAEDGTEFRFRGKADAAPGHETGDVVIILREKMHKVFQRQADASLAMTKRISLAEALCGFQFATKFLDGEDLMIRSRPGQVVKPGEVLIIKGRGMPRPHGQKPGDLYVRLEVDFPSTLPKETQEMLIPLLGTGPPLAEPPPGATYADKLSARQAQQLQQQWAQRAREQDRRGGDATCVQQ